MIRVKAKRLCYVDHVRRYPGDEFSVEEKDFSKVSMERLDGGRVSEKKFEVVSEPEEDSGDVI